MDAVRSMTRLASRKYLSGSRGATCKLRIPGVCIGGTETTIPAHIRDRHAGRSIKASDLSVADACFECHRKFDGQAGEPLSREDWLFYALRGLQETLEARQAAGLLFIPLDAPKPLPREAYAPSQAKGRARGNPAASRPVAEGQSHPEQAISQAEGRRMSKAMNAEQPLDAVLRDIAERAPSCLSWPEIRALRAAADALSPTPAPDAGVTEGWKMVPMEPTEAMLDEASAAEDTLHACTDGGFSVNDLYRTIYAAMLNAALSAPTPAVDGLVERLRTTGAERLAAEPTDNPEHYMSVYARLSREDGALMMEAAEALASAEARAAALDHECQLSMRTIAEERARAEKAEALLKENFGRTLVQANHDLRNRAEAAEAAEARADRLMVDASNHAAKAETARRERDDANARADRLERELERVRKAIATKGGTEHAPTQDAYEMACKAIEKHRARADRLENERDEARAQMAILEAGLEPFAACVLPEEMEVVPAKHFRRARALTRKERT
jgi:hypothetical protein